MVRIDLNSDLGESYGAWQMGDDEAMLEVVSSANIACGFHAGDPAALLRTLQAAQQRGVRIGAHVAYPDLAGFGRRAMDIASDDLTAAVIYQIGALRGLACAAHAEVCYVKPHGALYNTIAHDARQAEAVIRAILALDPSLTLVALAGAPLVAQARAAGLRVVTEVFADRAYTAAGTLVSRRETGAVLHDPQAVAARLVHWAQHGVIPSVDGGEVEIRAESICVHGDTPDAVAMARAVRAALADAGMTIAPFVDA